MNVGETEIYTNSCVLQELFDKSKVNSANLLSFSDGDLLDIVKDRNQDVVVMRGQFASNAVKFINSAAGRILFKTMKGLNK